MERVQRDLPGFSNVNIKVHANNSQVVTQGGQSEPWVLLCFPNDLAGLGLNVRYGSAGNVAGCGLTSAAVPGRGFAAAERTDGLVCLLPLFCLIGFLLRHAASAYTPLRPGGEDISLEPEAGNGELPLFVTRSSFLS